MAFGVAREIASGTSGGKDDKGIRKYTRTFNLICTTTTDGAAAAMVALGVPRIGDVYTDLAGNVDTGARCKSIKPQRDSDNPYLWTIACEYDSAPRDSNDKDKDKPPLERPAKISYRGASRRVAMEYDVNNKWVVNTSGDPFDPPIEMDQYRLVMEIEKNVAVFNPQVIVEFVNSTNNDYFYGNTPNTVLLMDLTANSQEEDGFLFWQVKYVFEFNPEGYKTKILNQGVNEIVYDSTGGFVEKRAVVDTKTKQARTKPVLLDKDGQAIDDEDFWQDAVDPHFEEFQFHHSQPFSGLGL